MQTNKQWQDVRKDFPILDQQVHGHQLVYLDNAATTQKPKQVIEALDHFYLRDNSNVHRGIHELSNRSTVAFEDARERAAKFLNARSSNEIIFTRGTTESINLVANTWAAKNLKPGDTILLTEMEHHSNIVPWQMIAERTGAKLSYIPVTVDYGLIDTSKLDTFLNQSVKLFSF
ncbi:MAG: aminotransferase class V-fold PLP-dependent enzyme, partial [Limisphaerales bacterium]